MISVHPPCLSVSSGETNVPAIGVPGDHHRVDDQNKMQAICAETAFNAIALTYTTVFHQALSIKRQVLAHKTWESVHHERIIGKVSYTPVHPQHKTCITHVQLSGPTGSQRETGRGRWKDLMWGSHVSKVDLCSCLCGVLIACHFQVTIMLTCSCACLVPMHRAATRFTTSLNYSCGRSATRAATSCTHVVSTYRPCQAARLSPVPDDMPVIALQNTSG